MRKAVSVLLVSLMGLVGSYAWAGSAREDSLERLKLSTDVLKAIMAAPDNGIPEEVLDGAKCLIVVPDLIKGGFIFGGKHGRGVATCRTSNAWSAPAFVSVSGGSWGLQIGVEGVDLVMLVMNEQGLQHLLSSKFQLSGEGSAAAGPVGRHAALVTLGVCYERVARFGGGAYHSILRRLENFSDEPLRSALKHHEKRATLVLDVEERVAAVVKKLKERGLVSPYLRSFVVARINPLRWIKGDVPSFEDVLKTMHERVAKFNVEKIKPQDLAGAAGPPDEET